MTAVQAIDHGEQYPYDAPDGAFLTGSVPTAFDAAHVAARGIIADLTDRRDIKRGFERVELDVRIEIVESLASIIREAMARG